MVYHHTEQLETVVPVEFTEPATPTAVSAHLPTPDTAGGVNIGIQRVAERQGTRTGIHLEITVEDLAE